MIRRYGATAAFVAITLAFAWAAWSGERQGDRADRAIRGQERTQTEAGRERDEARRAQQRLESQITDLRAQVHFIEAAGQNQQQIQARVLLETIDRLVAQVQSLGGRPVVVRPTSAQRPTGGLTSPPANPPANAPPPPASPPAGQPPQPQPQAEGCLLTIPGLGCVLR